MPPRRFPRLSCERERELREAKEAMEAERAAAEAAEKKRKSGLSPTELLKEEGDKHYKAASFEEAIKSYTKVGARAARRPTRRRAC